MKSPVWFSPWFMGLNPELGDRVLLLREEDVATVGPEILRAARCAGTTVAILTNSAASNTGGTWDAFQVAAYFSSSIMTSLPEGLQSGAGAILTPASLAPRTFVVAPYSSILLRGDQMRPTPTPASATCLNLVLPSATPCITDTPAWRKPSLRLANIQNSRADA